MRKGFKVLLILFAIALVTLCLAVGFFLLDFCGILDLPVTEILRDTSPDGKYQVLVEQLGVADWPFGPVTARITVKNAETGRRIQRFKEEVMNDGAGLYDSQFTVVWEDGLVKILIDPAESDLIQRTIALSS